jgi:DNA-binding MarR family transcriptional regulator
VDIIDQALARLATLDRLTVQQARVLLYIAQNPGTSATGIIMALELRQQTVSHTIAALSTGVRGRREGLGLVASKVNDTNGRFRSYDLTELGSFFIRKLLA